MPIFNASGTQASSLIGQVQTALASFRSGIEAATDLYGWSSGVSLPDLTAAPPDGPGLEETDAQDILSACADANGLLSLFLTGADPRNPPAGYNYGNSIRRVLGPRMR